jgi:hypothetical protein
MPNLSPPAQKKICFTPEEAQWLYTALQLAREVVARRLRERGQNPEDNEAYRVYTRLHDCCWNFYVETKD